ncbi:MAG: hypothetical protein JXR46_13395 [Calditrichaceae bacterium]|nr:hypothetical protein [Calditrichaceae bacterium]MBN2710031.1 hypothetical protein [Calditrichaceae bacterium]RQV92131.1 MAG: hypothetical protein EH224_16440 [Calditrichota bacterium]
MKEKLPANLYRRIPSWINKKFQIPNSKLPRKASLEKRSLSGVPLGISSKKQITNKYQILNSSEEVPLEPYSMFLFNLKCVIIDGLKFQCF